MFSLSIIQSFFRFVKGFLKSFLDFFLHFLFLVKKDKFGEKISGFFILFFVILLILLRRHAKIILDKYERMLKCRPIGWRKAHEKEKEGKNGLHKT